MQKPGSQFSVGKVMWCGPVGDPYLNTEGSWDTRVALEPPQFPAHFYLCTFKGEGRLSQARKDNTCTLLPE